MRFAAISVIAATSACAPRLYTEAGLNPQTWVAPENSWPLSEPPAALSAEGFAAGQVVPDLRLMDQHAAEVSLWQFHGRIVALDISTMWCAPCQELASGTEETTHQFAGEDFVYLTVLQEDVESEAPDLEDLTLWAEEFGITSPILADGEKHTGPAIQQGQFPAVLLIGRDLRVIERVNPADDPSVRAAVADAL